MKTLCVLSLLLTTWAAPGQDGSGVSVVGYRWEKRREVVAAASADGPMIPAAAVTRAGKTFERNRPVNNPAGVRDPNADTLDARSAALERNVHASRAADQRRTLDGFAYRAKIQNAGQKVIEVVFWEYQFRETANPSNVARRQFLCGVEVKPGKSKELQAFSLAGPGDKVSAASLDAKGLKLFEEGVVINRVESSDGSIWQRSDWNFADVRAAVARATATPWGAEMCRGL